MEDRGEHPLLPPVAHRHLIGWWLEIGPTAPGGMGDAPLPIAQIRNDMEALGVDLAPWEARAIRRMSREFLSQQHEARKPHCLPPYTASEEQAQVKDKVAEQFKGLISAFNARV